MSLRLSRFQFELGMLMLLRVQIAQNLKRYFAIVDAIAAPQGITPAQLSIA